MRTAGALEKLYARSGLSTSYRTPETTTHDDFVPVTVWLLERAAAETPEPKTETRSEEDEDHSFDSNGHYKNLDLTEKEKRLHHEIHNHVPQ